MLKPKVNERDVVLDRCYLDPELDAARDAVADTARPAAERAEVALRTVLARRGYVEHQLLAQDVLAEAGHTLADELQRRAADPALTDEERGDALGLAAAAQVTAAWQACVRARWRSASASGVTESPSSFSPPRP